MPDEIRIDTTQNVKISFELASLGDRIAAGVIDVVVSAGYAFLILYLAIEDILPTGLGFVIFYMLPVVFYPLLFEQFNNGQSIGKMVLKTKVVRIDGTEPNFGNYFIRWLLNLFEGGVIAVVVILFSGEGQRLGDMLAGTTVAKQKKRVSLEDTLFEDVEENYIVKYDTVGKLDDRDIETIKTVVAAFEKSYSTSTAKLMNTTREAIKQKLEVNSVEDSDRDFLMQVVKDYNFVTGKVNN